MVPWLETRDGNVPAKLDNLRVRGDKQGETAATIRMRRSAPARNVGRA